MKEKFKLTPLEKHWILYDVGNSAFTLLVSTQASLTNKIFYFISK